MGERKTFAEMTEAEQIEEIKQILAELPKLEVPPSATAAATVEAILASEEEES